MRSRQLRQRRWLTLHRRMFVLEDFSMSRPVSSAGVGRSVICASHRVINESSTIERQSLGLPSFLNRFERFYRAQHRPAVPARFVRLPQKRRQRLRPFHVSCLLSRLFAAYRILKRPGRPVRYGCTLVSRTEIHGHKRNFNREQLGVVVFAKVEALPSSIVDISINQCIYIFIFIYVFHVPQRVQYPLSDILHNARSVPRPSQYPGFFLVDATLIR